jgi:predicted 3-demethylubiquinone-9 3-methyltransferase (glyoxalase superfamily)
MPKIVPNLWFDTQASEAAEYYCSVFPNSRVLSTSHYPDAVEEKAGQVLTVEFELDGQRFTALNGGPEFEFNEAVSFLIECEDQDEIDHYWDTLSDGGKELPCGWVADRYGLAWQVVPKGMDELFARDAEGASRAMKAMFGMKKLDIAALNAAAAGEPATV